MTGFDESESDDGTGLYLFWRYIAWRIRRGLPLLNLDDPDVVATVVDELDELLDGIVVTRVSAP